MAFELSVPREFLVNRKNYQILLILVLFHIFNPSTILRAFKNTKIIFSSHLISMIVAVILSILLIKSFGMIGGAVGFVIAGLTRTSIQMVYVKKTLHLTLYEFLPWKKIFGITLLSLLCSIIPLYILYQNYSDFATIIFSGGSFVITLVLLYFIRGDLSKNKILVFYKKIRG